MTYLALLTLVVSDKQKWSTGIQQNYPLAFDKIPTVASSTSLVDLSTWLVVYVEATIRS